MTLLELLILLCAVGAIVFGAYSIREKKKQNGPDKKRKDDDEDGGGGGPKVPD